MQSNTELNRAVSDLMYNYERAVSNPLIKKPIAWALYKTWRMYNNKGVVANGKQERNQKGS